MEVQIRVQHVWPALTDSLPLSCMPFVSRDSDLDRLSISSMIPWMWSPEIPWKSMAPGPGRNLQLPGSVLQPTTSIYCHCSAAPRSLQRLGQGRTNTRRARTQVTLLATAQGSWKKQHKEQTTTWMAPASRRKCLPPGKKKKEKRKSSSPNASGTGWGWRERGGGLSAHCSPLIMAESYFL